MTPGRGFLRDNLFLVAAVSLPLIVVAFFLASSAIPRWRVPPPTYDLLMKATDGYNPASPRATVDFEVRNGNVEAIVRPLAPNAYGVRSRLFVFDHNRMSVREIPVDLPNLEEVKEGDPPRTIVVDALPGRQLLAEAKAPDGYQFESRSRRGPGIVGEVFGMNRYDPEAAVLNRGRVIPIVLPSPYQNVYVSPVYSLGWLVPESNS